MDIDSYLNSIINDNKFNYNGNVILTNREISVLKRYNIDYSKCNSLREVLYLIDSSMDDYEDVEDLEIVADSIKERDYYMNTNK